MKKIPYLAIGLLAGLLIGLTSTAYAEQVSAVFSKLVIKVNGEEKELGADPLVYQGTTYLPVRVVANILGYDVTYKADLKTVELSNTDTKSKPEVPATQQPEPSNEAPEQTSTPLETSGGNPMIDDSTLEKINSQIDSLKSSIEIRERTLLLTNRSENEKDALRDQIEELKKQISDLESQKTTLEAEATHNP